MQYFYIIYEYIFITHLLIIVIFEIYLYCKR